MEYLKVCDDSLKKAAKVLQDGGLVAFPTETVYGLGADAFNPLALAKIFETKGRPHFDPLIIHIASIKTLEKVTDLSLLKEDRRKKLFLLAENLWPGPLSIILPKNKNIPDIATAGLPTCAVRFPDHDIARSLISLSTGAVAAPSANPFGELSPTKAQHVRDKLGDKIDIILDGGCTRIGLESTVLDITGKDICILRPGGTPKEIIEEIVKEDLLQRYGGTEGAQVSPGLLKSHYAPRVPLFVFSAQEIDSLPYEKNAAYLFFDGASRDIWLKKHMPQQPCLKVLSETGNLIEAASQLFEILHEIEAGSNSSGYSKIFAQSSPNHGLGTAINDRLQRAGG